MSEKKFWNPEMETISSDELAALETRALKKQLAYVYEKSPFYREKFDQAGIGPKNFLNREDLEKFPFTTKEDLRLTQETMGGLGGHQCADIKDIIRIQGTSGTTGRPLFIGLTKNDVSLWNDMFARHAWTGGLRPEDVMINPANFTLFVGGLSECSGAESMGITVIPAPFVSTGMEKFMDLVKELRPTILFSTPSATHFLETIVKDNLKMNPSDLGFKKGFLAGEALSEEERKKIEAAWGITARNFYGLADVGADIAAECGQSKGLHFCAQGALVPELIDPSTLAPIPMAEGAVGEIVFTTINREATPVIRYRVRDMVRVYTDPCACGRTGFRFHVIGRSDDMIKVKGINVFPGAVKGVIQSFCPESEMRIVLPHKGPSFGDNITIKVEQEKDQTGEQLETLGKNLRNALREKLVFTPKIQWVPADTFEKSQYKVEYFERTYE
ncbi:MAG: phenylacetate--CoA ligase [Desulfobacteraceae bacterium]|nr:phenylacetate--CoA ligase [Desulfobacteraceae bacterium]